ncbi:hypothetical protein [Pseudoxanthomonas sp. X-1]|uniref:PD-(D/E)XK nuclease family protein n=1 Tax=Pseudoxanthomonas sp. X-1 TaxID=2571115 RepID=UPI00110B2696|nr:hypothetical protein [Pseudoxanthomonas sp. X-1]TMN18497.1 hypothetical protein FF950_14550 [Pseudoxanthomonas sp. X-1]UAY75997.1 hypothetical protein LAJ50_07105 [Pseudoxanthomonas sp. X-1]
MLARVSNIESFRRWREDEEQTVEQLVQWLTTDNPSEAMLAGTAFHKALEDAAPGEYTEMEALGHKFILPDCDLALPTIRELRSYGMYGPLRVTGQVDGLQGRRVIDHKTTSRFDAERYLDGYQWRYYLDLFEADVFRWNVFVVKRVDHQVYEVSPPQTLEAYRYPGMRQDCERLAADYYEFANQHLRQAA